MPNPSELVRELNNLLQQVNRQIAEVDEVAFSMNATASKVRQTDGQFMLTPLLRLKTDIVLALFKLEGYDV